MAKKTIDDIQVAGKRVLVRCDFNVPMVDGKITSDKRIVAALPTIKKLIAARRQGHSVQPYGQAARTSPEAKFSLAPVAERLSLIMLGKPVVFADDRQRGGREGEGSCAASDEGWRRGAAGRTPASARKRTKNEHELLPRSWPLWRTCYVDDAFGSCAPCALPPPRA